MITLLFTLGMFGAFFDVVYGKHDVKKVRFGRVSRKLWYVSLFRSVCTLCEDILILVFKGAKGIYTYILKKQTTKKSENIEKPQPNTSKAKVTSLNDYKCDKRSRVG